MPDGPGTESIASPRWLLEDSDRFVALWRQILIVIWRDEMKVEALDALDERARELARVSTGGRLGRFVVVEKAAKRPSPGAKEKLTSLAADWPMAFTAYVFEAEGFDAAAVRGIVTGVVLLARPSYPIQLHRSVADAARWVEMVAPAYASAAALEAVVRDLRQAHGVMGR